MSKDTIYRQAAIEALNEYFARIGKLKRRGLTKGEKAISLDVVGAIKALPFAQPEWIPCSERLPYAEYGESPNVYCYCYDPDLGGKWAQLLYYDGGVWCLPTGETFEYKVLAWYPLPGHPLPEPYKEDEQNG